jgi:hypothetical protein
MKYKGRREEAPAHFFQYTASEIPSLPTCQRTSRNATQIWGSADALQQKMSISDKRSRILKLQARNQARLRI